MSKHLFNIKFCRFKNFASIKFNSIPRERKISYRFNFKKTEIGQSTLIKRNYCNYNKKTKKNKKSSLNDALRKLYLKVHPDLFTYFPHEQVRQLILLYTDYN